MSNGLKLYINFVSPPSRALYICLKQSGIPFEKILINLGKGEQLTDEFKKLNRFQKVPCITDGDFKLAESVAILRYLASTNRISKSLYTDENEQKRANIDEYLQWNYTLRKECLNVFHLDYLIPFRTGKLTPIDELHEAKRDMERVFDFFETTWLNSSKFLTGNEITVADIFGATEIQQTIISKYDVGKKYPKIAEWIESVRQKTNPHFDETHKVLYQIVKNMKA